MRWPYGISPSSTASIKDLKTALQNQGIQMSYENLSVAYGTTDVGPDILAMKGAGTDIGRRSAETIEDLDCAIGVVGGWCCK